MVFYQGEALKSRVKKICEGYHATVYPCPEKASDRREMMYGVNTRLEDLSTVLAQTEEHRRRLISTGARSLRVWFTKASSK
jgi:V-type H+-transporting ATPase subunit a